MIKRDEYSGHLVVRGVFPSSSSHIPSIAPFLLTNFFFRKRLLYKKFASFSISWSKQEPTVYCCMSFWAAEKLFFSLSTFSFLSRNMFHFTGDEEERPQAQLWPQRVAFLPFKIFHIRFPFGREETSICNSSNV